jgi:hypothetical protein
MNTPEQTFLTQAQPISEGQNGQQPFVSNAQGDEELRYSQSGWSWGGFMLHIYFAGCVRRYWYLVWIIAFVIPFLNIPIIIGLMIYFGIKGRVIASSSPVFKNKQQYIGFMKGIDHAGKVMFFLLVVVLGGIAVLGVLASTVLVGLSNQREGTRDVSAITTARSVVPIMMICKDVGGSVESRRPRAGDVICSETASVDDVYPELPEGWEYGAVRNELDMNFSFSVIDTMNGTAYVCTIHGCEWEEKAIK